MTEERKQQALILLNQYKECIVNGQLNAIKRKDMKEYNRLFKRWMILDDIQEEINK